MIKSNQTCTNIIKNSENVDPDHQISEVDTGFTSSGEEYEFYDSDDCYESSDDENMNVIVSNISLSIDSQQITTRADEVAVNEKKRKYFGKEQLTRKRLCNPEKWKKNIAKNAANKGLQYTSEFTKKVVPARSMKRSCGPGCRNQCENYISESQRKQLFSDFWRITEQSRKYEYINRFVSEHLKKSNQGADNKRKYSRKYTLTDESGKVFSVCSTMFLGTLAISEQMVKTALKKLRAGDAVLIDKRGTSEKTTRN